MQRPYLVETVLGGCWRGIRGGEEDYENSSVDSGLRDLFCKQPFTAEILNMVQEMVLGAKVPD